MKPYNDLQRIENLLLEFFGDEGLDFATERISDFFEYVFSSFCERSEPEVSRLLYTHYDILKLIEAAYLLPANLLPVLHMPTENYITTAKQIRAELENWDEFPSHLKPQEWSKPERVIEEFFELQTIDEWKDAVQGSLQSAIGCSSISERLTEVQFGFIIIQIHRLADAVWLLKVTGRIKTAELIEVEEDETTNS
ncbi:MAG: hypothetical protein E6Q24_07235 [Chitinophagaceae bacterium]|nr:MAG: hypothetical protein E6Q24_07235 [Chitinophagaceae bacterium]